MKKQLKKLKNVELLNLTETYWKVLNFFFSFPEQTIGLNDLSQAIKSAKTITKTTVLHLIEEGFLKKEEIGKAWRISAVPRHEYFAKIKIPFNLQMIYSARIVEEIHKVVTNTKSIILFGSYRWGTDNEKSDIDIGVEIIGNKEPEIIELGEINIGYRKNIKINMYLFSRNKVDLNLFNNISNGIVLDGFLEVRI